MKTRISCSAFARIQDSEGRFALHLATKESRIIMRPLGGAFRTGANGRQHLISAFGAHGFEDEHDLRFLAPVNEIGNLEGWFRTRRLRETSIMRMLIEQLRQLHILGIDPAQLREVLSHQTVHTGITARQGVRIPRTQYLVEVFDVTMSPEMLALLKRAAVGGTRPLHFATADEIRTQSGPGGNVSSLAYTLLSRGT